MDDCDTKSKKKQRRCKVCSTKTCFKCGKCSNRGEPLVLCHKDLRDCFARFHNEREYDLPSSATQ